MTTSEIREAPDG